MKVSARFVMLAPIPVMPFIVAAGWPAVWQSHHVIGLAMFASGFGLLTLARWQLGNAFSITPQATALVTHGLYARVRNPIYVFGMVMLTGLVLYLTRPLFLLAMIPLVIIQIVRARREALVLEARFGDAYRAYRARTWF